MREDQGTRGEKEQMTREPEMTTDGHKTRKIERPEIIQRIQRSGGFLVLV